MGERTFSDTNAFTTFPLFRVYTFPGTILSSHFWEFSQDKRQLSLNVCIVYCIRYVIYNWRHICISMNEAFILRYTCASGPIKWNLPTSVFMPSQYWASVNESCWCYFHENTDILLYVFYFFLFFWLERMDIVHLEPSTAVPLLFPFIRTEKRPTGWWSFIRPQQAEKWPTDKMLNQCHKCQTNATNVSNATHATNAKQMPQMSQMLNKCHKC